MLTAAGQVAREAGRWLRLLSALALLLMLGIGAGAWRLSNGPIDLPFLARAIEDQANDPATNARLEVAHAIIAS